MRLNKTIKLSLFSVVTANMLYANGSLDTEKKFDTVTVTANKVEENIQDIPQSISVIDSTIIEEKGIKSVADIIKEIPNMTGIPDHGMAVNFRGLNSSMFTNNNPVVIYIDGIPTSDRYSYDASLENIQRVEILRGPQGTLYGKDAIGGVINIVTKEPTNEISGSVGLEYGSNNYKQGRFNLNAPIVEDKLYFNLNADINSDDGWVTNQFNNDEKAEKEEEKKFGTSFLYKVNDKLSTKLVLKKEKSEDHWQNGYGVPNATRLSQFKRANAENTSFDMPSSQEKDIDAQSVKVTYEEDKFTFDSVTTHRTAKLEGKYDGDFTNGTAYDGSYMFDDSKTDTYTQEFRLSNKTTDDIRWVSGLYFDTSERKQGPYGQDYYFNGMKMMYGNAVSTSDSKTYAIFGQTMIPLNEELELTLGGRYQKIKKEIDMTVDSFMMGFGASSFDFNAEKTWNVFIPKAALSYKITDNVTPYISISKGYMPGGFNYYAASQNELENRFEPQQSTNYELGVKTTFDDVVFNASLFRMDIKDIHVYRQIGGQYFTDNAKKAHSQGIEFDITYFPTDTLELNASVGIIKAEYDDYDNGTNKFDGEKIENTPSHTASLSVAYYHPSGFYARTDIKNQGDMYFYDDYQKTFLKEKSHTLVDAKIGYKFSDWDIYLYGKNLTDEEYIDTFKGNSVVSVATFGDPRFVGFGVKYTF